MGTKVLLNVYDLSPANDFLYPVGFGLHHSGVECLGQEYSYASGGGIFESTPKEAPGARFRETIELGMFEGGSSELRTVIGDLRSSFGPDDYNLIRKNCNHFANALVWALLGRQIPAYVNRLADIGVCCSCLLPKQLIEESPVGPNGGRSSGGGSGGSSGFQVYEGRGRSSGPATGSAPTAAFIGRGSKLGGGDDSGAGGGERGGMGSMFGTTSGSKAKGSDDLTDRREKARQAALARLDKSNKG